VVRRRRLAFLFPLFFVFLALRALSHAHPAPLPWTTGVFDADGLDDLLKTIRIAYSQTGDPHRAVAGPFAIPMGIASLWEGLPGSETLRTAVHPRAPPSL
jgi:hypothetical protein